MLKLGWRPRRMWSILLVWSAVACFPIGTARAVPVTDYIAVQPIDVCFGQSSSTCAPINNLGQTFSTAAVGNVGAVTSTGINVTRAILDQIGVDVTFLPAVPAFNMASSFVLPVDSCLPDGTDCQSAQFKMLSQQPGISGNPPPPLPPQPPLSPNPTTINAFFVNTLSPPPNPTGGSLFGLAWVNNNGVTVARNSLSGLGARPDTLAHEIGHDLDLGHNNFGAGLPNNLMTAGNSRLPQPNPDLAVKGIGPGMGQGTNDQLLPTQQTQVLLSGFRNPIPLVNTPASGTDFNISFVSGGRPGEKLDSLTLTAPTSLFSLGTQVEFFNPNGIPIPPPPTPSNCSASGCTSLIFDFTHGASFVAGDSIDYSICGPTESCNPISVDELLGGTYTYTFETDLDGKPIELFQTTSQLVGPGDLFSNSQDPDLLFPSQILNPLTFVGFSSEPCTIIAPATTCPPLELEDAWPPEENQPVPEPPALLILLSALAGLAVAYRCSSSARSSFEASLA